MIIVRLYGGMGNQMFQYALGRALSIKNNVPLGLDLSFLLDRTPHPAFQKFVFRNYDLDVFNIKAQIISQEKVPFLYRRHFKGKISLFFDYFQNHFLKTRGMEKGFQFDSKMLSFGSNAYLNGYWQSPKYFAGIEDIIRKDFTLRKPLSEKSQQLFEKISSENSLCINVRRRDFVGNSFNSFVGKEYYYKGIEYIKTLQNIEKIYIFSDDIEWCKNNFNFSIPTQIVGYEYKGEKFEEYLYLMSACKYFIISNSTFAWWAAWLSKRGDKLVIAPQQWFGGKSINIDDLIPKEWIRI